NQLDLSINKDFLNKLFNKCFVNLRFMMIFCLSLSVGHCPSAFIQLFRICLKIIPMFNTYSVFKTVYIKSDGGFKKEIVYVNKSIITVLKLTDHICVNFIHGHLIMQVQNCL